MLGRKGLLQGRVMRSARSAAVFLLRSGRRERQPARQLHFPPPCRRVAELVAVHRERERWSKDRKGNVGDRWGSLSIVAGREHPPVDFALKFSPLQKARKKKLCSELAILWSVGLTCLHAGVVLIIVYSTPWAMQLAQGRSKPTLGVVAAESNATLESSLEPTVLPSALRIQGLQNPKSTHTRVRGRTPHGGGVVSR
jgi:hypothetical protein